MAYNMSMTIRSQGREQILRNRRKMTQYIYKNFDLIKSHKILKHLSRALKIELNYASSKNNSSRIKAK